MSTPDIRAVVREEILKALAGLKKPEAQASAQEQRQAKNAEVIARWLKNQEYGRTQVKTGGRAGTILPTLKNILQATTARLGVGRAGVRPKAKVVLQFLADHAIAKRAVYEEFPAEKVRALGLFEVQSQVKEKQEFLLRPDLGRVLRPECAQAIKAKCVATPDVQIVVSDGLSGIALEVNIEKLLKSLSEKLSAKGYKMGTPVYCKYGRVQLQDRIAEIVQARSSVILIGERPGLGTGDGLSAYLIYNPGPTSTHANRNCISNIHPRGLEPEAAADQIVFVLAQMFQQQTSGVDLDLHTGEKL